MKDQTTELTKLEKFLIKEGRQDFLVQTQQASTDQLKVKQLELAKHAQEIEDTKQNDEKLIEITEQKKVLEEPYKEQLKFNKKMARYVHIISKEKGGG